MNPKHYRLSNHTNITVADIWNFENRIWDLGLRRHPKDDEIVEWTSLSHLLHSTSLTDVNDSWN